MNSEFWEISATLTSQCSGMVWDDAGGQVAMFNTQIMSINIKHKKFAKGMCPIDYQEIGDKGTHIEVDRSKYKRYMLRHLQKKARFHIFFPRLET